MGLVNGVTLSSLARGMAAEALSTAALSFASLDQFGLAVSSVSAATSTGSRPMTLAIRAWL